MLTYDNFSYATDEDNVWRAMIIKGVELVSGKRRLWQLYESCRSAYEPDDFFSEAIRHLQLRIRIGGAGLEAIPRDGPLIVIANHPFGVIDGLLIGDLISRIRPDFKILVHSALCKVPEPLANFLPVDFSETREAQAVNLATRRTALDDLARGHVVAIFPAGGISMSETVFAPSTDLEWKTFLARLVKSGQAPVLPIYFEGQCSPLFQLASRISFDLRIALLFRETVRMIGNEISVRIGQPINQETLSRFTDRRALTDHLRERTYALAPAKSRFVYRRERGGGPPLAR